MHGCVGDNPVSLVGPGVGEERGPCTSGGACNAPLQCLSKICVYDASDAALDDAKHADASTDASTDAASDAGPKSCGHNGEPPCVFVTEATYPGNFMLSQSPNFADTTCQEAANRHHPGGPNYYAVVGASSASTVQDNLKKNSMRGWALVDGTPVVQAGSSFLAQQTLLAPIHLSESNRDVTVTEGMSACVWTGAEASGKTSTDNCSNFTSSGSILATPNGRIGRINGAASEWLSSASLPCDTKCHLYCIQLP